MKAYKGFNKDLKCRDLQYEVRGEYETDRVDLCKAGFHACENPLDCMNYYSPNDGCVYHEVEVDGEIHRSDDDSKIAATKIKIGARISIVDIVKGAIDFVFGKTSPISGDFAHAVSAGSDAHAATSGRYAHASTVGNYAHAVTSGNDAHAATAGNYAHAVTSGDDAHAATSGYDAHAATSGRRARAVTLGRHSHAVTSGNDAHATTSGVCANAATLGACANAVTLGSRAHAEVKGSNSIAAVLGCGCRARGAMGCWLVLTERDDDGRILDVRAVKIDGEKVKSDTWYELRDGDVVEVKV